MAKQTSDQLEWIRDQLRAAIPFIFAKNLADACVIQLMAEDRNLYIAGRSFLVSTVCDDEGEFTGVWEVSKAVYVDEYPHGPAWVDYVEGPQSHSAHDVVQSVLQYLTLMYYEEFTDRQVTEAMANEMNDQPPPPADLVDDEPEIEEF